MNRPNKLEIPPAIRHIAHIKGGPAFKALAIVSLVFIAVNTATDLLRKINAREDNDRGR